MIIGSTYYDSPTLTLPNRPFYAQTYLEAAKVFFQLLYLNIFTDGLNVSPFFEPSTLIDLRAVADISNDPILKAAVTSSKGQLTDAILLTIINNSGIAEAGAFEKSLCNWVYLCYGKDFLVDYTNLEPIFFNDRGDLYAATGGLWPYGDLRIDCGRQQAVNNTRFSPFYRWLNIVTKSILDHEILGLDRLFQIVLPLMSGPLNPTAMYRRQDALSLRLPLANFVSILSRMRSLTTTNAHGSYDMLRQNAWSRFFSFGALKFTLIDPEGASAYFNMLDTTLGNNYTDQLPLYCTLRDTILELCARNTNIGCYYVADSEPARTNRFALEAFDLISDKAVQGDGTDGTSGTTDDTEEGDPDDVTDPANQPTSTTTADNVETDAGNNPMSIVQKSPSSVNNNSIGETSSGSKTLDAVTPVLRTGSNPGQLNKDYAYLMSVVTLNSRIREEPDFKIDPAHRDALESWCRYWVWIYPVSDTQALMKEWGLQSLLSPF